ncbi:hypothetical protein TNCV_3010001 [Trichonephila clavipes]|nr:hypothetical protein TNCV_3010001 [Trichonephila clavipes]
MMHLDTTLTGDRYVSILSDHVPGPALAVSPAGQRASSCSMAIVVTTFSRSSVVVGRKNFLINFNLEKLLSPLATLIGRVSNILKTIPRFGAKSRTATAASDVVQSGRPIFDDFFQHLWPYIGNNTANVVFQMVKRLWLIRIDQ